MAPVRRDAATLTDPWWPRATEPSGPWAARDLGAVAAVATLAVIGPALAVADNGSAGRVGARYLIVLAVLGALAIVLRCPTWVRVLASVLAVGAAAGSVVHLGRAPAAVVVVGLVVAALAVCPRSIVRDAPLGSRSTLSVLIIVSANSTWAHLGSIPLAVSLLAVAAAIALVAVRRPSVFAGFEAALARSVRSASHGLAVALVALVALPLLLLPAAMAGAWRRLRRRNAPSGWVPRAVPLAVSRADAPRPFASTDPRLARRRLRGSLGAALLLVAIGAGMLALGSSDEPGQPAPHRQVNLLSRSVDEQRYSEQPAFAGVPFADALQREQFSYSPDLAGTYTNVVGGARRTRQPAAGGPEPLSVWFVGGSAAFGIGQRDLHTIASELVARADRAGRPLAVSNIARPGWTSSDERREVVRRLRSQPAPDAIVIYDGFNDALAAVVDTALHGPRSDEPPRLISADVATYNRQLPSLSPYGGPVAAGALAASKYRSEHAAIDRALDGSSTVVLRIFQPDAFAAPPQLAIFARSIGVPVDAVATSDVARTLDATAEDLRGTTIDMRELYAHEPRPVFVGTVHTNELGARMAAAAIYERLAPLLSGR